MSKYFISRLEWVLILSIVMLYSTFTYWFISIEGRLAEEKDIWRRTSVRLEEMERQTMLRRHLEREQIHAN